MPRKRGFPFPVLRVFVLAAVSVVACVYALMRANRPRPPMVVPAPAEVLDANAELPAPDLEPASR